MIIFHGTGQRVESEKLQYHAGVIVEFNPTAYMNDGLFERYITNYLIPVLGGWPTLFVLNLMGSHKTPTVLDILRKNNITPSLIPGGCTSLVQPLDISVNKPFKDLIRDLTDECIFELESTEEFERWTVRNRHIMTTHCVGDAFYKFHSEKASIICTSFRKVGLSLLVDGSLDGELDIKGFTGLEIGNWQQDLGSVDDSADVRSEEDHEVEFVSGFE
ncbi:hypothetical protein L873DRAFT_1848156 [Choiromyces venosus 120613-1]|uniref:DDE-1 domain-containing protein n=1 Tax=Choiromyces venosus 120613-1 TaxID=1336337 RepID=A0A3N4J5B0_9PEZI|nr:hypothetical protein L873DRAFT_1848156 [Choiromyces venosus 120613-1]